MLLRRIVRDLRRKFKDRIAVCAMTGIAAVNIGEHYLRKCFKEDLSSKSIADTLSNYPGGQTLHSWAGKSAFRLGVYSHMLTCKHLSLTGIGLGNREGVALAKSIKGNKELKERWQRVRVLLIDEISMLDSMLFDKLCLVAESVRGAKRPFGGIQVRIWMLHGLLLLSSDESLNVSAMLSWCSAAVSSADYVRRDTNRATANSLRSQISFNCRLS